MTKSMVHTMLIFFCSFSVYEGNKSLVLGSAIKNGEHDWDFVMQNLEPTLQFVGEVFFGRLN